MHCSLNFGLMNFLVIYAEILPVLIIIATKSALIGYHKKKEHHNST